MWLRDHCRCPKCFHPVTKQRLLNTFDVGTQLLYVLVFSHAKLQIPKDIAPILVEPQPAGLEVTCVFIPSNAMFPCLSFVDRAIERATYVILSMVMASPEFV